MEIVFESTRSFEKELANFMNEEWKVIIYRINQSAPLFLTDKFALFRK